MADDDPYVYPGTDTLRNRLGVREATELAEQEAALSSIRIAQLDRRFIPGDYDLAHLQATHSYIFGEVYPWAGELRTVRIAKGGDLFALSEHIGPYLTTLFADLARDDRLQGLEREQFVERLTTTTPRSTPSIPSARATGAPNARSSARSPRPPAIPLHGSTSMPSATSSPPARAIVAITHYSTRCSTTSWNRPAPHSGHPLLSCLDSLLTQARSKLRHTQPGSSLTG